LQHDWYQTETQVVVEVRIKNMKSEDVKVDIQETTLSVTAKLPLGNLSLMEVIEYVSREGEYSSDHRCHP
jgi:HSP20 family molecular chaperone IbpA